MEVLLKEPASSQQKIMELLDSHKELKEAKADVQRDMREELKDSVTMKQGDMLM